LEIARICARDDKKSHSFRSINERGSGRLISVGRVFFLSASLESAFPERPAVCYGGVLLRLSLRTETRVGGQGRVNSPWE
jgi:hypothetical protein